jgi:hypothetical protein
MFKGVQHYKYIDKYIVLIRPKRASPEESRWMKSQGLSK